MYWGYHLILDCRGCNDNIDDEVEIEDFVKDLVKRIDMVAHGDPIIKYFGAGNKAGYSLVQLITTSSITAHFVTESKHIYLDVFSCKPFDINEVQNCVREYFGAQNIKPTFLKRNAEF
jgi:S-adenosylmethionine/arginine decarboxylase-like enzyme